MKTLNQWVVWRSVLKPGQIKPTKLPINPLTLEPASSTDPRTWSDYGTALAMLSVDTSLQGVGFILTPNDPYFLLDLDGCRDIDTGAMTPEAVAICSAFVKQDASGASRVAAWEVSQSGEGLHIIGRCNGEALRAHRNKWNGWLECYTRDRFIAFNPAGNGNLYGDPSIDWTQTLQAIVPLRPADVGSDQDGYDGPRSDWKGPTDDEELIARILASKGGPAVRLGQAPEPSALWHGDAHVLAAFYPDQTGMRAYDASSADQALMNVLAYWTGCDHERMIRLFSRSALGQRDKWTKRAYYRRHTVSSSIRTTHKVYQGKKADIAQEVRREQLRAENASIADSLNEIPDHPPILTLDEMLERFRYIEKSTTVVDKNTGVIYPSLVIAGRKFCASMTQYTDDNGKIKEISTFKQWENHPRRIDRQNINWLPNGPEKLPSLDHPGQNDYNLWRGFVQPTQAEAMRDNDDVRSAWLQVWRHHLAFLIPIAAERVRFEQWLAHMMRVPEELPHTAYLMWTETHGVGRNLLATMICRVMRGYVLPNVELGKLFDAAFNSQLSRKLMVIVDEIKEGGDNRERYKRENQLRQTITADTRQINEKHTKERTEHSRIRWLFFSNHPDALPFSNNDRRIYVIKNPSVKQSEQYYDWIIRTIARPEFYAALFAHLMWKVPLEGFDPGAAAPMNEAKRESISSMENPIVGDLRDIANNVAPDTLMAASAIAARLAMDYGAKTEGIHPRTWAGYLKAAGFVQIPHKIKLFGNKEYVYIVRPEKLSVDDFFVADSQNLRDGATDYIRRILQGS